ncbi:MAG: hypothetical protein ACFFDN_04310 [Candidatus Hodarchaeota archaeon]
MKIFNNKVNIERRNNIVNSSIIFFSSTLLLLYYLLSMRANIQLPIILFFINIILMISVVLYQCFNIASYREFSPHSYINIILFEIAILNFVFHLIYQIPFYGLVGIDALGDYSSAKSIVFTGHVMGDPEYITNYSYFPIIHIFGVILSYISGIDLYVVAKWFPSFIDTSLILILYLFVRIIYTEEIISLISILLYSCIQHRILFSSLFIRETIALVLTILSIYLYYKAQKGINTTINYGLSFICLFATIFSHHLTSFMLNLFLFIHYIFIKATKTPFLSKYYFNNNINGIKINTNYLLFGITTMLLYWEYIIMYPLNTIATFLRRVFFPRQGVITYTQIRGISLSSLAAQTLRGSIIYYGFFFFHFFLGLIMLYRLLPKSRSSNVETYSFTFYFFITGLIGFVSLYFIPTGVFPDRFLMFGWLFSSAPLILSILRIRNKLLLRFCVFILVTFMIFNIYMIHPNTWDLSAERGVMDAVSEEDYLLSYTIDFANGEIFGTPYPLAAIREIQNVEGTRLSSSEKDLSRYDWIIYEKKVIEGVIIKTNTTEALMELSIGNSVDYIKIYESNRFVVFKIRK